MDPVTSTKDKSTDDLFKQEKLKRYQEEKMYDPEEATELLNSGELSSEGKFGSGAASGDRDGQQLPSSSKFKMKKPLAVHVKGVTKCYGSEVILENVDMHVEDGTIYGLLGSSGCGKTTLLGCIVGTKKFKTGEITRLGEGIDGVPGDTVGYMPQEIALVNEFSVKDSLYFFGRIYNMNSKAIEERYQELKKLLDLPPDKRLIDKCSGGEKRRISFAIALIHHPKLLILDEPSVGVDPILRERIWNYLRQLTLTKQSTVILTTHYIDEAKSAHKIGFLRKGTIIKEECPMKLIQDFGCPNLEDVFFRLSEAQDKNVEQSNPNDAECSNSAPSFETLTIVDNPSQVLTETEKPSRRRNSMFALHRLHALLFKNFKQVLGNKIGYLILLIIPIVQLWIVFLAVGRNILDMPLAIVNDESACINENSTVIADENWECHFSKISCRLLTFLEDPVISKIHYDDLATASDAVRNGKVVGVFHINKNISVSMETRINSSPLDFEDLNETEIDVYLDMSNVLLGGEMKHKLSDLYTDFVKSIYSDCGIPTKAGQLPIIQKNMYYVERDPYVVFLTPGLLLSMVFFVGMFLTSFIIVMEKSIGIWERSIIAGVTSTELFLSHLLIQSVEMFLITISILISVFIIYGNIFAENIFNMFVFIFLQGLTGLFFGYFVSTFCNNFMMVNIFVTSLMFPVSSLSGIIWPIQAMPLYLQIISKASPLTLSIEAFRNVMMKGWSLCNPDVLIGIAIPICWVFLLAIVSIYVVKMQR